ncbi:glycosyltransferase family 2 protein [Candidatus Uhrbacteria bacterium]|nr:glycosyltransferase family 2 protein [Candidatus Uhrbacteria bacterium]
MADAGPKVSFVTVCYRTPNLVRQLLTGLEAASLTFPFEYFVVDNGGDGTADMVRERFPWAIVLEGHGNVGFGAGNNRAFREAKGEYVMLVNPDLTVFPGEIERLVAFADAEPSAGLVGPRLVNPDRSVQRTFHRFPDSLIPLYRRTRLGRTPWGRRAVANYLMEDADPSVVRDVDGLFGAAILIRRSALDAIGHFDERFFMYFEDVDLCRRAWEAGWRVVYAPVAEFVHYHQRESEVKHLWGAPLNRLARAHIASGVKYFWKYRGKEHPRAVSGG